MIRDIRSGKGLEGLPRFHCHQVIHLINRLPIEIEGLI